MFDYKCKIEYLEENEKIYIDRKERKIFMYFLEKSLSLSKY